MLRQSLLAVLFVWSSWTIVPPITVRAQTSVFNDDILDSSYYLRVSRAIDLIKNFDTTRRSYFFPNVDPALFYHNLKNNILHPDKFTQGRKTNFCGLAAASHIFMRYQPEAYTRMLLALFNNGEVAYKGGLIKPSKRLRKAVGTLRMHAGLDLHHADQIWLLSLAGHFKGYVNLVNMNYNWGDESIIWASVNLSKFNHLLEKLGRYEVHTWGSDLCRTNFKNTFDFLAQKLQEGLVVTFINSHALQPSSYKHHLLVTPTHFIQLYELQRIGNGNVLMTFWDYGEKTLIMVPETQLKKVLYGVTVLTLKDAPQS